MANNRTQFQPQKIRVNRIRGSVSDSLLGDYVVSVSNGGTGSDMSDTGDDGHFVKQESAGAAFTVGSIDASDIPDLEYLVFLHWFYDL